MEVICMDESAVDFALLRKANYLLFKWSKRENISKTFFVRWCLQTYKNLDEYKKTLPVNMRSAFAKDVKVMFYALEVEDSLIKKYTQMIWFIITKLKIKEQLYEDMYSLGLLTIRNSIWQYRTHKTKCSFTTWVHNSLFLRIKGNYNKEMKKLLTRKKYVYNITDYSSELVMEEFSDRSNYFLQDSELLDANESYAEMLKHAKLSESELFMLETFMKRHDKIYMADKKSWHQEYAVRYQSESITGKLTREAIRQRLMKLLRKCWIAWYKSKNLPAPKFNFGGAKRAV